MVKPAIIMFDFMRKDIVVQKLLYNKKSGFPIEEALITGLCSNPQLYVPIIEELAKHTELSKELMKRLGIAKQQFGNQKIIEQDERIRSLDNVIRILTKGDKVGHPFHGNQWTTFAKVGTVAEGRAFVENLGLKANIPDDVNLEGLNNSLRALHNIIGKYGMPRGLDGFGIENFPNATTGATYRNNMIKHKLEGEPYSAQIVVNKDHLNSNTIIGRYEKMASNTYTLLGESEVELTTLHELGHAYDIPVEGEYLKPEMNEKGEMILKRNSPNFNDFIEFKNSLKNEEGKIPYSVLNKNSVPSAYSLSNANEYVAETFVQAHVGTGKISKLQKIMLERITKWN